jgi:glyoxylase I family protein
MPSHDWTTSGPQSSAGSTIGDDRVGEPTMTGLHHVSLTVSDVEASARWYEQVLRLDRMPAAFPHYGDEHGGYGVLLVDRSTGIRIGLHHHQANPGHSFAERRTGLDHVAFGVATRTALDANAAWLDALGVANSGVIDVEDPIPYSTVVFRDPDNIQLEFVFVPS